MGKLPLLEEFTFPPPPYFSVVVERPITVDNSKNNSTLSTQTTGNIGVHSCQPQTLALYSGHSAQYPCHHMVQECSLIEYVFAAQEKLSFHSNTNTGRGNVIVKTLGNGNRLLMSILNSTTVTTGHPGRMEWYTERRVTVSFNDPTGITIMNCEVFHNEVIVKAGNRLLGKIRGSSTSFTSFGDTPFAKNCDGKIIFETVDQGTGFIFVAANGITLARARKGTIHAYDFSVEFLKSMESSTKALIVVASYFMCQPKNFERSYSLCILPMFLLFIACIFLLMNWFKKRTRVGLNGC
ncbi:unnamed protein product [Allacma fusca]|uniref:Uncharacterized protein n=1 Tax=Allacma fusca TaxID=39272 RepID=A0A8J2JYG4_9HEXA|nr:unnamed protein product [Allacma fusca]